MATPTFDDLAAARYLSLTTFKRDGTPVASPVWLAPEGDRLYVITEDGSGKIKRLRHTSRVLLAPCDMRGRFEGPQAEGTARLLDDPAGVAATQAKVKARYGWQYSLNDLVSKVRTRGKGRPGVGIEIAVTGPAPS